MMKNERRSNGEGSWGIRVINGVEYVTFRKSYGSTRKQFYGKTKTEVRKKVQKFEAQKQIVSESAIQKMSFYVYADNWLKHWRKKNIKSRTFDYYEMIIDNYIKDTIVGRMQIKYMNKDHFATSKAIEDLLYSYKDKLSKSTIDGIYTVLKQVCKFSYKKGDINYNWMDDVDKISSEEVKVSKKKKQALDYKQLLMLWDEMLRKNTSEFRINGKEGTYVYGICAYALLFVGFTGLRWGEVSCIMWKDIDFEKKILCVDKQYVTIKNRSGNKEENHYLLKESSVKSTSSERLIPLCDQALEILELVKSRFCPKQKPEALVFTKTGSPIQERNANRTLKCMCTRQGLPLITPHELRHTFASVLLNQDKQNLYTVSNLLGHSTSDVTYKSYIHIFEEEKAKTINIFDKLKETNK